MKNVPNLFTLLNLVCGCIAIILSMTYSPIAPLTEDGTFFREPVALSVGFIFLAGIIDFLDGFLARLMKASSEMGKQLDSLCDAVTFGVAPALMMFRLIQLTALPEDNIFVMPLPSLAIACCAVWRLAKFNIDIRQSTIFYGVPTPITAMVVASLVLIVFYNEWNLRDVLLHPWLLYGITFLLSIMMVADVPIMSLKFKAASFKSNQPQWILLLTSFLLIILFQWAAVPLIYLVYVALSLFYRKQLNSN